MTDYGRWVALCLLAGAVSSTGGVLVRALGGLDPWAINLYRALAMAAAMGAFVAWRYGAGWWRALRDVGGAGALTAALMAGALIVNIFAVTHATVAHVLFIMTTRPLFAALLGRAALGERVRRETWIAMGVSAAGIAIMVGGQPLGDAWIGSAAALAGAFCTGAAAVAARAGRQRDLVPTVALSAAIMVPASLIAGAGGVAVAARDLMLCVVMGLFQTTLGLLLYIAGARYLPAAQTVMLGLVEVFLAPLWVLVAFAEVPAWASVAGGVLVLVAVMGQGVAGARAARRGVPA